MSTGEETVKLHVTIDIHEDDPSVDTGVPLSTWNAMDDAGRDEVVKRVWSDVAIDHGGVSVVTPGAAGI